jgi:glycosyltransferase involved in cell wall biosynthesis
MPFSAMNHHRVAVIDPCYHRKGGHHHSINCDIARYFSWLNPIIYADKSLSLAEVSNDYPSGTSINPYFPDLGYIDPNSFSDFSGFCIHGKAFAVHLGGIKADTLVGHTLLHYHLYGLSLYLLRQKSKRVILSLMFSPFDGLRNEPNEELDFSFTSLALRSLNDAALSKGHEIIIGITSEVHWELVKQFRQAYSFLKFRKSPWLVGWHNSCDRINLPPFQESKRGQRNRIILYLGDAKPDKGIETTRDFLRWLKQQPQNQLDNASSKMQLEVHVTSCNEWLKPCVHEISSLCEQMQGLIMFSDKQYENKQYFEILATASKIVWLYNAKNYRYRTSGIFYDAVSVASILHSKESFPNYIVSQESWMDKEFPLLGYNPESIDLNKDSWQDNLWKYIVEPIDAIENQQLSANLLHPYIGQSWNAWIESHLFTGQDQMVQLIKKLGTFTRLTIVISTEYPHFTHLSGPTGFVKHIEGAIHLKTRLGKSDKYNWIRNLTGLKSATDEALNLEIELIKILARKPVDIICIDGEHAGSLLALAHRDGQLHPDTRILAWYHQPSDVMKSDIFMESVFASQHIEPICISPCQVAYFQARLNVNIDKIKVIPHGVHKELIDIGSAGMLKRTTKMKSNKSTSKQFLTVGNWLRDRKLIFLAAKNYPQYSFKWISTGMILDENELEEAKTISNLKIVTTGLSNDELHVEYIAADYLFQPLIDATANNAIIEAMAFGLPIITKRLKSTTFYTASHALYYTDANEAIEILGKLGGFGDDERQSMSESLHGQSKTFEWKLISEKFLESLNRY